MSDIPIQPAAPIPREQLCSEERNSKFIYPCGGRQCTWKPGAEMKTSPHVVKPIAEKPKILPNILHTIGNTPLVRLNNIPKSFGIKCEMRRVFI